MVVDMQMPTASGTKGETTTQIRAIAPKFGFLRLSGAREVFLLLFLAFVTLGLYYPAILAPFCLLDDQILAHQVLNNFSWSFVKAQFSLGHGGIYFRPLSTAVFYFIARGFGLEATPFHLFNVLVHLGSGLLVYFILRRIYTERGSVNWLAFTAAMIFLVHPLNVEAVAWVSGRPTVMATFFILVAFLCHLGARGGLKDWRLWVAALCYLLSLLSYELAVAMPLVFIYWDLDRNRGPGWGETARRCQRRWWPYGLVLTGYLAYRVLRGLSQPGGGGEAEPVFLNFLDSFQEHYTSLFVALGFYLKKAFWPWPLNLYISHVRAVARPFYLAGGVLFTLALAWWSWRRSWPRFWTWWFFCGLLMVLPLAFRSFSWTPAAERYVYLSSIAFAAVIAVLVFKTGELWPAWLGHTAKALVLGIIVVFGISTTMRAQTWQSDLALAEDTWRQNPESGRIADVYARALYNHGHRQEAIEYWKRAMELGNISKPARSLGDIEKEKRNYAAAEKYYLQSLWPIKALGQKRVHPMNEVGLLHKRDPDVYLDLADLHARMMAEQPALRQYHQERIIHFYRAASKLKPDDLYLQYLVAKALLRFGHLQEAEKTFAKVAALAPETYYGRAAAKLASRAKAGRKGGKARGFRSFIEGLKKKGQLSDVAVSFVSGSKPH